jgi:hypothetical protein
MLALLLLVQLYVPPLDLKALYTRTSHKQPNHYLLLAPCYLVATAIFQPFCYSSRVFPYAALHGPTDF